MRRNALLTVSVVTILLALILLAGCGKEDETAGTQLLKELNRNAFGMKYEVDSDNINAEEADGGFEVAFRDVNFVVNTEFLKETSFGENIKAAKLPVHFKEITFLYKPEKKYLELISMEGMSFRQDITDLIEMPESEDGSRVSVMDIALEAGSTEIEGYDLSPMITCEGDDIWQMVTKLVEKNQEVEAVTEDLEYKIAMKGAGAGGEGSNIEDLNMTLSADEIRIDQNNISSFFVNLYGKDGLLPDMNELLKKNHPLFDIESSFKNMKFSFNAVEEGEKISGSGSMSDASFSYYVKPNEQQTHFDFGFDYNLGAVNMTIPFEDAAETAEILSGIRKLNISFALKHLSPQLVGTYLELTRKSMNLQNGPDNMKEVTSGMGQQLVGQLMMSQPVVDLSIQPFVHEVGKMEISAEFSMPQAMAPDGAAELKIYDIQKVLAGMKGMKGMDEQDITTFRQWADRMLEIDNQGNGTLTFRMKKEEPGVRYLNGKRMN